MNKAIFAPGVMLVLALLSAAAQEEYVVLSPSETTVESGAQVVFKATYVKDGKSQKVMPFDFNFSAPKGELAGNVYTAPEAPGTYLVFVYYKEIMGLAMVTVRSSEEIGRMEIYPQKTNLKPGETLTFQAKVYGQSGNLLSFSPAWGAKGGKITQDGNFQAGEQPGTYNIVAWGPQGIKASADISIIKSVSPTLTRLKITPDSTTVRIGEKVRFEVQGYDQSDQPMAAQVQWQATGGVITQQGEFTAGEKPGTCEITASCGDVRAVAQISVEPLPPILTRLKISPESAKVQTGKKVSFKAQGLDQYGNSMTVKVTWSAEGGSITGKGKFVAGEKPGTYEVKAISGNICAVARVTIELASPVLTQIKIVPESPQVRAGEKIRLRAEGYDQYGNPIEAAVKWIGEGGTIGEDGNFTAGSKPGTYPVKAIGQQNVEASVSVTVVAPPRYALLITPQKTAVVPGGQVIYEVKLYRDDKEIVTYPWEFTYAVNEGSFKDNVYTAPTKPGTYQVKVRHSEATGTAVVEVKEPERPIQPVAPKVTGIKVEPGDTVELKCGESIRFMAAPVDADGKALEFKLQWEIAGGTLKDNVFTAGDVPGTYKIKVIEPGSQVAREITVVVKAVVFPYRVEVNPNHVILPPGGKQEFEVKVFQGVHEIPAMPWEIEAVTTAGVFQNCKYTAPTQPGQYRITVRYQTAQAKVLVEVREEKATQGGHIL